MKIYIASSWKNQHAVEMLTKMIRDLGYEVLSFVENSHGEQMGGQAIDKDGKPVNLEEWINSERGRRSFDFDLNGATESDVVIYIGPSGSDAWAEVGAAWASNVHIIGLIAKGENIGLMRRMVHTWCYSFKECLSLLLELGKLRGK